MFMLLKKAKKSVFKFFKNGFFIGAKAKCYFFILFLMQQESRRFLLQRKKTKFMIWT